MWRSTLEIGAALLNKSGWRLFTDTGHGRLVNKKKLIEWKTLVHFVRIESVDFLWTTAIEISRYGDALSCKKEAHLLLSKALIAKEAELPFAMQLACKQRKYLTKKLDRCFVNGSRPTGEILVSWCANTKTNEAVRSLFWQWAANNAVYCQQSLRRAPMSLEDFPGVNEKHRNRHAFHAYWKGNFSILIFRFLGNI